MFGALHATEGPAPAAMLDIARDFTPRFERCGPDAVLLDLSGLTRLCGGPHALGRELCLAAAARAVRAGVAIAGTGTAARLLAMPAPHAAPCTDAVIVPPGAEAAAVALLPLARLARVAAEWNGSNDPHAAGEVLRAFHRWGLRTLGDLAALPAGAVVARLGPVGARWHRLAKGHDVRPLRPEVPEEHFEQSLDLEWPIDGMEPLSFVLGGLLDRLAAHLERRGRAAAVLSARLHLVTRTVHERSLQLPAPIRDARALRTLLLLDLSSHPAPAAIDRVVVAADPTPARVLQYSLLTPPLPSPEQLSTLMARLDALMGARRCGSPAVVDSWQPGACAMTPFEPDPGSRIPDSDVYTGRNPAVALRRFRPPIPARIRVEHDVPVLVSVDRQGAGGGRVERCAGPWRASGGWWGDASWNRDEWDVALGDGATYRVFRDRATEAWFLDGIYD